ncbi:single-stranded DNA-binding protein [Candidatus Phytoplasma pyri]|uniref:single-stranded DNA-binding protein n=1 Tax=Candidatus Phytoplasma pyri TaxID=47566 RepID=UPI003983538A
MLNQVTLIGRITKDIELKTFTVNDETIKKVDFQLAVNSSKDKVDFITCVGFRKIAENMKSFLKKGSKIAIIGKIKTNSFEKDGKKQFRTYVTVNNMVFLDKKSD